MAKIFLTFALCLLSLCGKAQTVLFHTGDSTGYPYRIPAIAKAPNGDIIAMSDLRPSGKDIGFGRVDILSRISKDNGRTWSVPTTVLRGTGKGEDAGFGDACLVADRKRNELLLVCCSGDIAYWQSSIDHHQRILTYRAVYNKKRSEWIWDKHPVDVTKRFYDELLQGTVGGLFMGSGRICQSKRVKVGKYYRLYAALCTQRGNFVVYSDDFGRSWELLGTCEQSCAPKGDEPKCEELPDGSVLLSSRKHGGRWFNIYRYTDVKKGQGLWGEPVDSREAPKGISNEGTPCNGEILILPVRKRDSGKETVLALQSIPAGPNRANVTIYFKELTSPETYNTPLRFASDWAGSYRVSILGSAYSTMVQQADGRIAFFYEEEPDNYQMVYKSLDLSTITSGRYEAL